MRAALEVALGLVHVAGAVFNTLYTSRHYARFFGDFAEGAWLEPAESFIRRFVIPNGAALTALLIAFQAAVAIAILTRGDFVTPALLAGGTFALVVAFFSNPGGTMGNLVLAVLHFGLALTR